MTYFHRAAGAMAPSAPSPGSATVASVELNGVTSKARFILSFGFMQNEDQGCKNYLVFAVVHVKL